MRPQRNAGENAAAERRCWYSLGRFNEAPAKCRGKLDLDDRANHEFLAGFNEAPAKCRGKREHQCERRDAQRHASMRPQRNAGENVSEWDNARVQQKRASMRPQRNAGENRENECASEELQCASMRPQRNAGENAAGCLAAWNENPASMRPQRNAGENGGLNNSRARPHRLQ